MNYNKTIKIPTSEKGKTLVKIGNSRPIDNRIVFAFSFFNGESVITKDFNNFYQTEEDAINSVNEFFETIKNISRYDINSFFSFQTKIQLHYNEFVDNDVIDKIEDILINGYKMPKEKVDEFERLYFEFSFGDGKRVIGTKINHNIFEILFIDCNHLVCEKSSRNPKIKMRFSVPSVFGREIIKDEIKNYDEKELIELLIEDARMGAFENIDDLIKEYDSLFETTKS